jgi:hypothetical protein
MRLNVFEAHYRDELWHERSLTIDSHRFWTCRSAAGWRFGRRPSVDLTIRSVIAEFPRHGDLTVVSVRPRVRRAERRGKGAAGLTSPTVS